MYSSLIHPLEPSYTSVLRWAVAPEHISVQDLMLENWEMPKLFTSEVQASKSCGEGERCVQVKLTIEVLE